MIKYKLPLFLLVSSLLLLTVGWCLPDYPNNPTYEADKCLVRRYERYTYVKIYSKITWVSKEEVNYKLAVEHPMHTDYGDRVLPLEVFKDIYTLQIDCEEFDKAATEARIRLLENRQ